jgi:predicted DCC family thiol-disulfide oxidoreductase YuxK
LLFDGDCGFCTRSARVAERRLHLEYVEPWQSVDIESLGLTEQECASAVQWVDLGGSIASGEYAVIAALRSAGGAWGICGRAMNLPGIRQLAGGLYRLVANNRHRL